MWQAWLQQIFCQGQASLYTVAPWLSLLQEHRCLLCHAPFVPCSDILSPLEPWLCAACKPKLAPFKAARCPACGEPVPSKDAVYCWRCIKSPPPWDAYAYYGLLQGDLRQLLLSFKFAGRLNLAHFFGDILLEVAACLPVCDVIVPIPSHTSRLRARGVSQTAVLAKALSQRTGLPVDFFILTRTRATPQQTQLSREVRMQAPCDSFAARPGLEGLRVLLLDDIVTTGATARYAAQCLRTSGVAAITLISVARTARW